MLRTAYSCESFGLSDIGLVRDHNEDVFQTLTSLRTYILADGMGGHSGGEVAAELAVTTLAELLIKGSSLKSAFEKVNEIVYEKGRGDLNLNGMGTTLLCLQIKEGIAHIAHVGDSRLYRLREQELEQLTMDHTLVAELTADGIMKEEDAATFPYRHILTRAIGTAKEQLPTLNQTSIELNDLFLLCSDGLTNFVCDDKIAQILLLQKLNLEGKAHKLIEEAKKNGGGDNVTVILVRITA